MKWSLHLVSPDSSSISLTIIYKKLSQFNESFLYVSIIPSTLSSAVTERDTSTPCRYCSSALWSSPKLKLQKTAASAQYKASTTSKLCLSLKLFRSWGFLQFLIYVNASILLLQWSFLLDAQIMLTSISATNSIALFCINLHICIINYCSVLCGILVLIVLQSGRQYYLAQMEEASILYRQFLYKYSQFLYSIPHALCGPSFSMLDCYLTIT